MSLWSFQLILEKEQIVPDPQIQRGGFMTKEESKELEEWEIYRELEMKIMKMKLRMVVNKNPYYLKHMRRNK